jgi:hypothetical protein
MGKLSIGAFFITKTGLAKLDIVGNGCVVAQEDENKTLENTFYEFEKLR